MSKSKNVHNLLIMEHDNDSYIKIIKAKRDALKKKLLSEQQTILKLKNEDSSITIVR